MWKTFQKQTLSTNARSLLSPTGFFEKEIKKDGLPMFGTNDNPEAPQPKEMVELEMTFEKLEKEVKIVNKNSEELKRTYLNLTELRSMLKKTQQFFDEVSSRLPRFMSLSPCYTAHHPFSLSQTHIFPGQKPPLSHLILISPVTPIPYPVIEYTNRLPRRPMSVFLDSVSTRHCLPDTV